MTQTQQVVELFFKDEYGKPFELTENQEAIFNLIWKKKHKRCHIMAHTRYGKSITVALAVLLRITTFAEKWVIIAGSEKKAKIIIGYIIDHTFDNDYFKVKLELDKSESIDRLRRERSKNRLVYKLDNGLYSEVFVLSGDSRNKAKAGDSLMGFGAPNVILDEAALIDDDIEAKVFRMLGDKIENFYFKIGNPFKRNHFYKDYRNKDFYHLNIDYKIGIKESRLTQGFIDEAKRKPHFSILYENMFPSPEAIDDKGWSYLITEPEFEKAQDIILPESWFGIKKMGVDIARGGGNYNVWTLRTENYARILAKNQDADLMSVVGTTIRLAKEYNIDPRNIFLDDTGVGAGVTDRLREQKFYANPVKLAEKPDNESMFVNRRAENYWKLKQSLLRGLKLCSLDDFSELLVVKYKAQDSSGKLLIMSKDEMKKQGIESPDIADALMLTEDKIGFIEIENQQQKSFDRFKVI